MIRRSVVRHALSMVAVPGLLLAALGAPALAEELARLTVELKVSGTEQVRGADQSREHAEGRFNDTYRFSVTLKSSGELNNVNIKDPQFAEKMMARAAAVQRQVERRQPPRPATTPLTPEQLEARAKAGQEACQGDINCLMALGQELQAQMVAMQAAAAPAAAPAIVDEDLDLEEEDYRYLDFFGTEDCTGEIRVVIDRRLTGEYEDVQGMVPYSVRHTADYTGNDVERQLTCLAAALVLDVEDQVFYTDGIGMPAARGQEVREEQGRAAETSESQVSLHGEISLWVAQQLRKAPVSGRQRATIELGQNRAGAISTGNYRGQAEVELEWQLARL